MEFKFFYDHINGHATPWHQDGQYWPIRPLATCTVWLAIDDANVENGYLRLLKVHIKKKLKIIILMIIKI